MSVGGNSTAFVRWTHRSLRLGCRSLINVPTTGSKVGWRHCFVHSCSVRGAESGTNCSAAYVDEHASYDDQGTARTLYGTVLVTGLVWARSHEIKLVDDSFDIIFGKDLNLATKKRRYNDREWSFTENPIVLESCVVDQETGRTYYCRATWTKPNHLALEVSCSPMGGELNFDNGEAVPKAVVNRA